MKLQRIAMVVPNNDGIYGLSSRPTLEITEEEFLLQYADYPEGYQVSFEDGISHPRTVTAYHTNDHGTDFPHIVVNGGDDWV